MKKFRLHAGTYDCEYLLFIAPREEGEQVLQVIRDGWEDQTLKYDFSESRGCCIRKFNYIPAIWFPRYPKTPTEYGTIAHECLHLTNYILLQWVDLPLTWECEEAYTHLLAKIVRDVLTTLKEDAKKKPPSECATDILTP